MVDIILTGLLLAVWLPGVAWAFAWWDVKKRATVALDDKASVMVELQALRNHVNDQAEALAVRLTNLERNLREAGLNPKTPLSKQAGMMPFGKRG